MNKSICSLQNHSVVLFSYHIRVNNAVLLTLMKPFLSWNVALLSSMNVPKVYKEVWEGLLLRGRLCKQTIQITTSLLFQNGLKLVVKPGQKLCHGKNKWVVTDYTRVRKAHFVNGVKSENTPLHIDYVPTVHLPKTLTSTKQSMVTSTSSLKRQSIPMIHLRQQFSRRTPITNTVLERDCFYARLTLTMFTWILRSGRHQVRAIMTQFCRD